MNYIYVSCALAAALAISVAWIVFGKIKFPFDGALRGIGGQYEITRVLGGFGAMAYCICANVFVAYQTMILHKDFDVTAYCLAFPGGLAVVIGAAAGSAALKDRNVASSKVIETTGVVPSKGGETQANLPEPPAEGETK